MKTINKIFAVTILGLVLTLSGLCLCNTDNGNIEKQAKSSTSYELITALEKDVD